jgi:hypothetical protein
LISHSSQLTSKECDYLNLNPNKLPNIPPKKSRRLGLSAIIENLTSRRVKQRTSRRKRLNRLLNRANKGLYPF